MSALQLRPATVDDADALRGLFAACFPSSPKCDTDVLRWQYWDNPFAPVRSWVWEDGGTLVAHYAGMPVPIVSPLGPTLGAVGIDAATLASHRGRGLFEQLAATVYRDCGEHGLVVTLCYPNTSSLRGFVKAGGLPVAELATYVFATDPDWVARRLRLPGPVAAALLRVAFRDRGDTAASPCAGVPPDVVDLWASISGDVAWGIRRDASWWSWRYASKPSSGYRYFELRREGRLAGAAVTRDREESGGRFRLLLEFLVDGPGSARELLAGIVGVSDDVHGIAAVAIPSSPTARAVTAAGMRRLPSHLGPRPLHFGFADNTGEHRGAAHDRWNVAWGDLDHL